MYGMGCQTFKQYAPSFFCTPSNLNEVWPGTVHICGIECWMMELQTGGGKVSLFDDDWTAAPFPPFRTVILVLADSFPPAKDPDPSA